MDPGDFYYRAKHSPHLSTTSLSVSFYRLNRSGDCNGGKSVSRNTLVCQGYTKRDVSIRRASLFFFNFFFARLSKFKSGRG